MQINIFCAVFSPAPINCMYHPVYSFNLGIIKVDSMDVDEWWKMIWPKYVKSQII